MMAKVDKNNKQFIANRIKEKQDLTKSRKWTYCPSASNPTDLITRGIAAEQYRQMEHSTA